MDSYWKGEYELSNDAITGRPTKMWAIQNMKKHEKADFPLSIDKTLLLNFFVQHHESFEIDP